MPRAIVRSGEKFSCSRFGDQLILQSNNDELNFFDICCISPIRDQGIKAPFMNILELFKQKTSSFLNTKLDSTLFYRYAFNEEEIFFIEMFRFNDNIFETVGHYNVEELEITIHGELLNSQWWIRWNDNRTIVLIDLISKESFPYTSPLLKTENDILVQDGIAYWINFKIRKIGCILDFSTDAPLFIDDHSTIYMDYHALDRTPGNNRFVMKDDEGCFGFSETFSRRIELTYDIPSGCRCFIRYEGYVVPKPRYYDGKVYCEVWDFKMLDNKIFVCEEEGDDTIFYPVVKYNTHGIMAFTKVSPYNEYQTSDLCLRKYEEWDFYHNVITIFRQAPDDDRYLQTRLFFDDNQWHKSIFVKVRSSYHLFIDDLLIGESPTTINECRCGLPRFNRNLIVYTQKIHDKFKVIVNGKHVGDIERQKHFQICANVLWLHSGKVITMLACDSVGIVMLRRVFEYHQDVISIRCNPFYSDEILINGCTILRYEVENDIFEYSGGFVDHNNFFIGKSVCFSHCICVFEEHRKIRCLDVPELFYAAGLIVFSPRPNVLVAAELNWDEFSFITHTLVLNDECTAFDIDCQKIEMQEFLTECEVMVVNY
ncbi:hypothetical protein PCE1_004028 [Barthelona sp. PCE]